MISSPADRVGYAETTMLVFEQFAEVAIAASKHKPNSTVLDVACGPDTATSWHEKQASLDETSAEGAADFRCVVGGGGEMMREIRSQEIRLRHYLTTYILTA